MVEIHQVAALAAKALLDLVSNPGRAVAHPVYSVAFAKDTSAPKSVMALYSGLEQPRWVTPALWTNGRMRRVALRYWGTSTRMSPKGVCQRSSFTFTVCPPAMAYILLALMDLHLSPGLHRFLTQALDLLDQTLLGIVGAP